MSMEWWKMSLDEENAFLTANAWCLDHEITVHPSILQVGVFWMLWVWSLGLNRLVRSVVLDNLGVIMMGWWYKV